MQEPPNIIQDSSVKPQNRLKCAWGKCEKQFAKQSQLFGHISAHHLRYLPYECPDPACYIFFGNCDEFHTHRSIVHPKMPADCPIPENFKPDLDAQLDTWFNKSLILSNVTPHSNATSGYRRLKKKSAPEKHLETSNSSPREDNISNEKLEKDNAELFENTILVTAESMLQRTETSDANAGILPSPSRVNDEEEHVLQSTEVSHVPCSSEIKNEKPDNKEKTQSCEQINVSEYDRDILVLLGEDLGDLEEDGSPLDLTSLYNSDNLASDSVKKESEFCPGRRWCKICKKLIWIAADCTKIDHVLNKHWEHKRLRILECPLCDFAATYRDKATLAEHMEIDHDNATVWGSSVGVGMIRSKHRERLDVVVKSCFSDSIKKPTKANKGFRRSNTKKMGSWSKSSQTTSSQKTSSPDLTDSLLTARQTVESRFCEICKKEVNVFPRRHVCMVHLSGEKLWKCPECTFGVSYNSHVVKVHLSRRHPESLAKLEDHSAEFESEIEDYVNKCFPGFQDRRKRGR